MTDVKEQAIDLRKQGLTYTQISSSLDGALSVDQLKRLLKGVVKPKVIDKSVEEIITLGTRPQGVTDYEATGIIYKYHKNASKDKVRYLKDKAKEIKDCIIHSGWIDTMHPNESHKSMNAIVLHLMDQVDLLVEDYIEMYPTTNRWSVRHEMIKLAFANKISGEPYTSRIYKNELLAELMEERNTAP